MGAVVSCMLKPVGRRVISEHLNWDTVRIFWSTVQHDTHYLTKAGLHPWHSLQTAGGGNVVAVANRLSNPAHKTDPRVIQQGSSPHR